MHLRVLSRDLLQIGLAPVVEVNHEAVARLGGGGEHLIALRVDLGVLDRLGADAGELGLGLLHAGVAEIVEAMIAEPGV